MNMASKKISLSIPMASNASKTRWKGSFSSSKSSIVAALMQVALLHHIIAFLLIIPSTNGSAISPSTTVSISNSHSKILTVRCFSFYDKDGPGRRHLQPKEVFNFTVKPNKFFPSTTMFNCSTNMGVFIAYRFDYSCSHQPSTTCDWRFDETQTYRKTDNGTWEVIDFHPNYESLGRGGVVKGYFTNK